MRKRAIQAALAAVLLHAALLTAWNLHTGRAPAPPAQRQAMEVQWITTDVAPPPAKRHEAPQMALRMPPPRKAEAAPPSRSTQRTAPDRSSASLAPAHAEAYGVLFRAPVTFDAAQTAITFDARYLALPLRRDEAALRQMLQHALPLTVLQYRRDRLLVQRVRQLLGAPQSAHCSHAVAALPPHNAETLAQLLHVSQRTLHRQLKEEGATLQGLKDEVRQGRAIDLLHRTDRPIKQVAEAAGFVNEKSFIRAFRTWTGQSPAEFRRQARATA